MIDLFKTLPKLLKEMSDNEAVREAVVGAAWRRIAGEGLSEQTSVVRLYQKHLIVAVGSEMWKRHLEQLSGQMIFKLNSTLGQAAVTFIEFLVDENLIEQQRAKRRAKLEDDAELREIALAQVSPNLRRAADAIKDENLRYQFLLAAGGCLARKQRDAKK